jgi:hypothetical protein
LQFGLLATLGSLGTQFALFFTMVVFVRPVKNPCDTICDDGITDDSSLSCCPASTVLILREQTNWFYWSLMIFHLCTAIVKVLKEKTKDFYLWLNTADQALNIF